MHESGTPEKKCMPSWRMYVSSAAGSTPLAFVGVAGSTGPWGTMLGLTLGEPPRSDAPGM